MVVLIDEDRHVVPPRRFRQAPPIASDVRNGKYGHGSRNDDDDFDFERPASQTALRIDGQGYGSGAARHIAIDTLRQPQGPRNLGVMSDQRATRSPSSSLRNFANGGHNGSTDTFDI
jgi:hypothetical protein